MSSKYSIEEIDRMRSATKMLNSSAVEDRLRTFMLNGTEPEEIEAAALMQHEMTVARVEAALAQSKHLIKPSKNWAA